jgi:cell division inhibitor SulA
MALSLRLAEIVAHKHFQAHMVNLLAPYLYQLCTARNRKSRSERLQLTSREGESREMIQKIGDAAGRIWQFVNENPASNLERINKHLKLELSVFCMALGWLAREDKIVFEGQGKELRVSLK